MVLILRLPAKCWDNKSMLHRPVSPSLQSICSPRSSQGGQGRQDVAPAPTHHHGSALCCSIRHSSTHPAGSSSLPDGSPSAAESFPKPGGSWGPQKDHPSARNTQSEGLIPNAFLQFQLLHWKGGGVVTHTTHEVLQPSEFCPKHLKSLT